MGVPEIVDFAREFSVMVRVQGADPKGLKMRNHAFHHYHSGQTTISASGMLLPHSLYNVSAPNVYFRGSDNDRNMMLVVTIASIVEPFLSLHNRQNISQAVPELIPGAQIDIMLEGKTNLKNCTMELDKQIENWLPAKLIRLVDVPDSAYALQSLIETSSSLPKNGWEVGWSLSSLNNAPQTFVDVIQTQSQGYSSSNPNLIGRLTTRIALLSVPATFSKDLPNIKVSTSNKRGNILLAMGSPFGILSPLHFFNSVSEGSISNIYPSSSSNKSLLMADIRCLPGMEGGPILGDKAQLIGILTRPLRQITSGAEIQLVIPWEAIATACSDLLHKEPRDSLSPKSLVEKAMTSICLITVDDGAWASGVVLNKLGLVLTNAHLLEPWRFKKTNSHSENAGLREDYKFRSIRVRLDCMEPWIWCGARVVYVSRGPLDVALLQIDSVPDQLCPIDIEFSSPEPGSKAYVIGHGLFGPRCDLSPSVCSGVVAKVVKTNMQFSDQSNLQESAFGNIPAMLETTAAVHPGGSGGAVVNSNGYLIGLVTSNARHGGGTVIPHLNFSIPCAALAPIFNFLKDMQNLSLLQDLDRPSEHLSSVWALIPPLSPKPDLLLPKLPQFLLNDNKKECKGSRFTKFLSETQEILKGPAQRGKVKIQSNDVLPSKL